MAVPIHANWHQMSPSQRDLALRKQYFPETIPEPEPWETKAKELVRKECEEHNEIRKALGKPEECLSEAQIQFKVDYEYWDKAGEALAKLAEEPKPRLIGKDEEIPVGELVRVPADHFTKRHETEVVRVRKQHANTIKVACKQYGISEDQAIEMLLNGSRRAAA